MNMEELSKSQIILLTLLLSFVTSIATGIVTVSLMDQAPPAIAQTVNRIIERTVEKVVPAGQSAATVVTQEKTIVVKESELISKAVELVNVSTVRLYASGAENPAFLGLGIVIDSSGTIVGDADSLGEGVVDVVAELADKSKVRATVSVTDTISGLVHFTTGTTTVDAKPDAKPIVWSPVTVATGRPMLGETVVMLAGKTIARIGAGIVTAVSTASDTGPGIIETDIAADSIISGSPLIDSDGTLLGISTHASRNASASGFVSATILLKPAPTEEEKKEE